MITDLMTVISYTVTMIGLGIAIGYPIGYIVGKIDEKK